jgi:CHAT domain-containing protein
VARSNIALLASILHPLPYTQEAAARITRLVEEARATAVRGGNRAIEGKSELYLAQLKFDLPEMRDHLQRGLTLCRETGNLSDALLAYRLLSESLVWNEPQDPERAMELLQEAVQIAEAAGSLQEVARNRIVQSNLHWKLLRDGNDAARDRDEAIRVSLSALDAIEAIRDSQSGATARARTFSPWVFFYSRFVGNLLWPPEAVPSPEDADRAFRVAERMRARVFLDELDAADAGREADDLPWSGLPGISKVQERLEDDEAVLSYLTEDLWMKEVFTGGSWVTFITRNHVKMYSLPQRTDLAAAVDLTLGSIRNRDGSERAGLERLYRDLLDAPLRDLPAGVNHLIIVPDGPLHRLPFGALQQPRQDEPLGARYRISLVPSLAAWLHWTDVEVQPPSRPALAWIDPDIDGTDRTGNERSRELGRLPYAALEARAARDHLGNGVQVFAAEQVTEHRFKEAALRDHEIVHVAAHAVVDDLHPDLSGIVLVGGGGEDGLLQVREIVSLDLGGRTVILSACRSASGATLGGEGVLSLARAFFVADAQAVVANLWPVRDDEAAAFSADLYRHLGEGQDLATALASARRDRVAAGDPTESWAGAVLFGNGRIAPFASGVRRTRWSWVHLAILAGILAVLAGFRGITLHRRRSN